MSLASAPKVYIILVNWNGWRDTIECLHSLEELAYPNYSIIIVDNGSSDQSVEKISSIFPDVRLIKSDKNLGFAGGNNLGIEQALNEGADYVWLLNNDTVVEPDALAELVDRMEEDQEIGICGSKLIYYHQRDTLQALAGGHYNQWLGTVSNIGNHESGNLQVDQQVVERQLDYIIGASMMVSRQFVQEVGLMNEEYFLYYEEIDWAIRGQRRKFKLGFAPESVVLHKEGASTGGRQSKAINRSKRSDYYQLKNRLKFTYNYFPFCLPSVYLAVIYALINRVRRGQWARIPMIIKLMVTFNK